MPIMVQGQAFAQAVKEGGYGKVPLITGKESEKISLRHQHSKEKGYGAYAPTKALFHAFFPGSLTVEAALALPIFLFAMVMVLYLFRMMQVQYIVENSLDKAVAEISLMSGVSEKEAENLAKASFYKELALQGCPISRIEHGIAGFSWKGTKVDASHMDMLVTYHIQFPLRFFGKKAMELSDGCRMHRWMGNQEGAAGNASGEWVYITPTQNVYHVSRECTHLKLSIKALAAKNPGWKKYAPCGHCIHGKKVGATVYVTSEGKCYHSKINCSGLKRTVYMVLREKAGDKKPCSRCGGK